ncbi:hypothetical protein BS17DRAFT_786654 [Gyrodon lividus]|nr:hypothetical protein BS17DRAFT_786654 [Gyrodon lividus]
MSPCMYVLLPRGCHGSLDSTDRPSDTCHATKPMLPPSSAQPNLSTRSRPPRSTQPAKTCVNRVWNGEALFEFTNQT